jgi:hypothetical protein
MLPLFGHYLLVLHDHGILAHTTTVAGHYSSNCSIIFALDFTYGPTTIGVKMSYVCVVWSAP